MFRELLRECVDRGEQRGEGVLREVSRAEQRRGERVQLPLEAAALMGVHPMVTAEDASSKVRSI